MGLPMRIYNILTAMGPMMTASICSFIISSLSRDCIWYLLKLYRIIIGCSCQAHNKQNQLLSLMQSTQQTPLDRIGKIFKYINDEQPDKHGKKTFTQTRVKLITDLLEKLKVDLKDLGRVKIIISKINENQTITEEMKEKAKNCSMQFFNMINFYVNSCQYVQETYQKFVPKNNVIGQKPSFWKKVYEVLIYFQKSISKKQKALASEDLTKKQEDKQYHQFVELNEQDFINLKQIKDSFQRLLSKRQQEQLLKIKSVICQLKQIKDQVIRKIESSKSMFETEKSHRKQDNPIDNLFEMIKYWRDQIIQNTTKLVNDITQEKKCAAILKIQEQCLKQYQQLANMTQKEFCKQWDCFQTTYELTYPKKIIRQVFNKVRRNYQIPKNERFFTHLNKRVHKKIQISHNQEKMIESLRRQKQNYEEQLKIQIENLNNLLKGKSQEIRLLELQKQEIQKKIVQQLKTNTSMAMQIGELKAQIKQLKLQKSREKKKVEQRDKYKGTIDNVQRILDQNKKNFDPFKDSTKRHNQQVTESLKNFMRLYNLFSQNQPKIFQIQKFLDIIMNGLQKCLFKSITGFTLVYRMGNDYSLEDVLRKRPNVLILAKIKNVQAIVGIFHSLSYCKQKEGSSQKSIIFTTQGSKFYDYPYTSNFLNVEDNGIYVCQNSLKINLVSKQFIINFKQLQSKVQSLENSSWFEFSGAQVQKCDLQILEIYQVHFNNEEIFTRNIQKLATYVEPDQENPEVRKLKQEVDDLKNTLKQKNNIIMKYKSKQKKVDTEVRNDSIKNEKDINKPHLQEEQAYYRKQKVESPKIDQKAEDVQSNYSQTEVQKLKIEQKIIDQIIKLERVQENAESNLTSVQTEVLSLHSKKDELNQSKNIKQKEEEYTNLTQSVNKLRQQVKHEEEIIERKKELSVQIEEKIKMIQDELIKSQEKQKEFQSMIIQKKALSSQLEQNQKCLKDFKKAIEAQTVNISDILKKKNAILDQLGKINSQIKDKKITVNQLDARIASLEKKESEQEISEEIKQLQKQRNKLSKQLKELKDDIDSNNKFCDDLLEKIQQKEQQLKQAVQEYAKIGDKKAQLTALNSELSSKNQELSRLQQELAEVNQSMLRVKEEKIKLQDLCIQLEKNQTELKAEQKQMELEIVSQKKKKSEHEKIVTRMKSSQLRDHSPPFFVGQCISSATQLLFLQENIQKLCEKRILKTRLVYSFPMMKSLNFHGCVDGIPHYVFILLLENQHLVALYSQEPLSKEQSGKGPGFLASLTNQHIFTLKEQLRHARLNLYDPYYFNIGNSDLRIQLHKYAPVYSNFGSNVCYFDSNGNKSPLPLTGSGEKETDLKAYEVFEVIFE